jgi:guanylate kinase
MMKAIDVTNKIAEQRPRIVYLSGKTCTGKTTFAKKLQELGYSIIELDPVVMKSVVIPFGVKPGEGFLTAYRGIGSKEQTQAFIDATKKEIQEKIKPSPVVVEGAIATPHILKEVFSENLNDFRFVYLHPVNSEVYSTRIKERFIAGAATGTSGLPKHFWEMVDQIDLEHFVNTKELNAGIEKALEEYTKLSMFESKKRLELFQEEFNDIQVVEI